MKLYPILIIYSRVPNKRPSPRLLNFPNFSNPHTLLFQRPRSYSNTPRLFHCPPPPPPPPPA